MTTAVVRVVPVNGSWRARAHARRQRRKASLKALFDRREKLDQLADSLRYYATEAREAGQFEEAARRDALSRVARQAAERTGRAVTRRLDADERRLYR